MPNISLILMNQYQIQSYREEVFHGSGQVTEEAFPGILGSFLRPLGCMSSLLHYFPCLHILKHSLEKSSPNRELCSRSEDTQITMKICSRCWPLDVQCLMLNCTPTDEPTIATQDERPDLSPWLSIPQPIFSLWYEDAIDRPKFSRCLCIVQNPFLHTLPGNLVWKKQPALADSLVDITRHMRQEEAMPRFHFCFCWSLLWFPMKRTFLRR